LFTPVGKERLRLTESPVADNFSPWFHNQVALAVPVMLGCSSPAETDHPFDGSPKTGTKSYFDWLSVEKSSRMTCANPVVEKKSKRTIRGGIGSLIAGNLVGRFWEPRSAPFIGRGV
jgi:hypothetical protein